MKYKIRLPYPLLKTGTYRKYETPRRSKGNVLLRQRKIIRGSPRIPSSWTMPKVIPWWTLLFGTAVNAATLHPLNEMKTLSIPISQEGMTRMAVKGDRIAGIYGITGEYTLEADEELGQVFLKPNLTNAQNAISLTLTTEEGVTQDLKLVLKDMAPEAIVLQKSQQASLDLARQQTRGTLLESEGALASSSITREDVTFLLESLREGLIPSGYQSTAVDLRQHAVPPLLIKEVKNTKLQGLVFEVENTSSEPLQLEEASFGDHPKTLAVALKNKIIIPGERTEVYVVRIL